MFFYCAYVAATTAVDLCINAAPQYKRNLKSYAL